MRWYCVHWDIWSTMEKTISRTCRPTNCWGKTCVIKARKHLVENVWILLHSDFYYCVIHNRVVTISDFHDTIVMAKRIHNNNIVTISVCLITYLTLMTSMCQKDSCLCGKSKCVRLNIHDIVKSKIIWIITCYWQLYSQGSVNYSNRLLYHSLFSLLLSNVLLPNFTVLFFTIT